MKKDDIPTATSDSLSASKNLLDQVEPTMIPAREKPTYITELVIAEIPPSIVTDIKPTKWLVSKFYVLFIV